MVQSLLDLVEDQRPQVVSIQIFRMVEIPKPKWYRTLKILASATIQLDKTQALQRKQTRII